MMCICLQGSVIPAFYLAKYVDRYVIADKFLESDEMNGCSYGNSMRKLKRLL